MQRYRKNFDSQIAGSIEQIVPNDIKYSKEAHAFKAKDYSKTMETHCRSVQST